MENSFPGVKPPQTWRTITPVVVELHYLLCKHDGTNEGARLIGEVGTPWFGPGCVVLMREDQIGAATRPQCERTIAKYLP